MYLRHLALMIAAGGLTACGADDDINTPDPNQPDLQLAPLSAAPLRPAEGEALANHIKNGLRLQVSGVNAPGSGGGHSSGSSSSSASSSGSSSSSSGSSSPTTPTPSPTPPPDGSSSSGGGGGDYSGTNVHVTGIDEADIVKYDGEHWYIALQAGVIDYELRPHARVQIARLDASEPSGQLIADYVFDDDIGIKEMYLAGEADNRKLAIMRQRHGNIPAVLPAWGGGFDFYWGYPDNGEFEVAMLDVSEPGEPQLSDAITIAGSLIDSRRIDDTLYLVTRFDPWLAQLRYGFGASDVEGANEAALAGARLADLMPTVTDSQGSRPLTETCLLAEDAQAYHGFAPMVFVSAIDLATGRLESSVCINGQVSGLAMFSESLYLSGELSNGGTVLHKFAVTAEGVEYAATGDVEGSLSGQADPAFRLDEHDDLLRVVTTRWGNVGWIDPPPPPGGGWTGSSTSSTSSTSTSSGNPLPPVATAASPTPTPSSSSSSSSSSSTSTTSATSTSTGGGWGGWGPEHRLTVLEQRGKRLVQLATLPNDARPDPIGKPGEDLYAVRFEGDMAYLVTFQRTDPLYAIDLSDPSDPKIVGELEIPGFATYMHPLAGDYLFTLGMYANEVGVQEGMKFELVKLDDGQPRVIDQVLLPEAFHSEALNNLRALSVLKVSEQRYRFALPVQRYTPDNELLSHGYGLQLLEVDLAEEALHNRGEILGTGGDRYGYSQLARGLLQDDAVFYASGEDVLAAPFDAPEQALAVEDLRDDRPRCDDYEGDSFVLRAQLREAEFETCPTLKVLHRHGSDQADLALTGKLEGGSCAYTGPEGAYGYFNASLDVPGHYPYSIDFEVYRNQCQLQTVNTEMTLTPMPQPIPCTGELVPSLAVDVSLAGEGGGDACEAAVTAFNEFNLGLYTLTGKATETGSCLFEGPFEREGYFILTVSLAGYLPYTDYAYVYSGACHVQTSEFSLQLQPDAATEPQPAPTEE